MGGGSRPSFGIGAMGLGSFGALIGIGSSSMDALMGLLGESSQSYWSGSSGYGYGRPPLGYSSPGFGARGYGPPPYGPPGLWARRLSNGQSAKRIFVLSSNCLRQQRKRVNADS
jgi:hypothetical protein